LECWYGLASAEGGFSGISMVSGKADIHGPKASAILGAVFADRRMAYPAFPNTVVARVETSRAGAGGNRVSRRWEIRNDAARRAIGGWYGKRSAAITGGFRGTRPGGVLGYHDVVNASNR
jgi:hypothetical protein